MFKSFQIHVKSCQDSLMQKSYVLKMWAILLKYMCPSFPSSNFLSVSYSWSWKWNGSLDFVKVHLNLKLNN